MSIWATSPVCLNGLLAAALVKVTLLALRVNACQWLARLRPLLLCEHGNAKSYMEASHCDEPARQIWTGRGQVSI